VGLAVRTSTPLIHRSTNPIPEFVETPVIVDQIIDDFLHRWIAVKPQFWKDVQFFVFVMNWCRDSEIPSHSTPSVVCVTIPPVFAKMRTQAQEQTQMMFRAIVARVEQIKWFV
jgi:hypothetical protein